MRRRVRTGVLTVALACCGVLLGAMAVAGGGALGLLMSPSEIAQVLVGIEVVAGGAFGAVMLPALAWALLSHVPLGYVLLAPTCGAALGHAVEWVVFDQTTFGGAATGALAAAVLVARGTRQREALAPSVPHRDEPVGVFEGHAGGHGTASPPFVDRPRARRADGSRVR